MSTSLLSCPTCETSIFAMRNCSYLGCYCHEAVDGRPPYCLTDQVDIQTLADEWGLSESGTVRFKILRWFPDDENLPKHALDLRPFNIEAVCWRIPDTQISPHPWRTELDWVGCQHIVLMLRAWHPNRPGFVESWIEPDGSEHLAIRLDNVRMGSNDDIKLLERVIQDIHAQGRAQGSTDFSKDEFLSKYHDVYYELKNKNGIPPEKIDVINRIPTTVPTFYRYKKMWKFPWPPKK